MAPRGCVSVALGVTRRPEERIGSRAVGDRPELSRGPHRLLAPAALAVRLGEQLERGRTLDDSLAERSHVAVASIHGCRQVALLER